jgi:hypothetical protein
MAAFKEFVGDGIVSTGQRMVGKFSIPRTTFGRGNVVACEWVYCELFEIMNTFKNSAVSKDDMMTEDQGVSILVTNGLVGPNKGKHFINAHDEIGSLVSILTCADIG